MVKRKVPEGWVEASEVRNANLEPLSATVSEEREDIGSVASLPEAKAVAEVATPQVEPSPNELAGQEVPAYEMFWRLLAEAGYECW